jgi:hypothetical protein
MMIRRLAVVAIGTLALLIPAATAYANPVLCLVKPNWC